jgi:hypothetical protein
MKTVEFDIGNTVICDICDKDYTHSNACGGFLFQSKGVCPDCAPRFLASVKRYGEMHFIRATAQDDELFREFILRERGGNNKVTISGGDADEVDRMAADYKDHLGIEK